MKLKNYIYQLKNNKNKTWVNQVNSSNPWHRLWDWTYKAITINYKAQSLMN
jgi:hypothetical protein